MHPLRLGPTWAEQEERLGDFLRWVDRGAMARAWALRYAVVCLGAGVALLPLPFLDFGPGQTLFAVTAVSVVTVAWILVDWRISGPRMGGVSPGPPERP